MPPCKKCKSESVLKNGFVRKHQRYRCNSCGYNFIEGDARINPTLPAKKAMAVILHNLGKASFNSLGRIFGVAPSLTYRWIAQEAEMWHFIGSEKNTGKPKNKTTPQKIHTFNHPEFGRLRVFENEKGELNFSLEDIARALGMSIEEAIEHLKDIQGGMLQ